MFGATAWKQDVVRLAGFVGLVLALGSGAAQANPGPFSPQIGEMCRPALIAQEAAFGIPPQLLSAVSLAESGRWHPVEKESFSWPWTVTSGKESWYLPTKVQAVQKVKQLRAGGVRNIDVGCMQINLMYHGDAFDSLEQAFDPQANVGYAAKFLRQLYDETRSWHRAVERYHSATPELHVPYHQKVQKLWSVERKRVAEERRVDAIADFHEAKIMDRRGPAAQMTEEERTALRAQADERRARVIADWHERKAAREAARVVLVAETKS